RSLPSDTDSIGRGDGEEPAVGATAGMMRLRTPRWKDPRLIVGIVLVVASVLMGAVLVSRLSETTPVLVARSAIVPGEPIAAEDLTTVELRLGEQTDHYVGTLEAIPEGTVALRTIRAGELVPKSAIGQARQRPLRRVRGPHAGRAGARRADRPLRRHPRGDRGGDRGAAHDPGRRAGADVGDRPGGGGAAAPRRDTGRRVRGGVRRPGGDGGAVAHRS